MFSGQAVNFYLRVPAYAYIICCKPVVYPNAMKLAEILGKRDSTANFILLKRIPKSNVKLGIISAKNWKNFFTEFFRQRISNEQCISTIIKHGMTGKQFLSSRKCFIHRNHWLVGYVAFYHKEIWNGALQHIADPLDDTKISPPCWRNSAGANIRSTSWWLLISQKNLSREYIPQLLVSQQEL